MSDEECIERGAVAIRILEYLKHRRFPGITLESQHICQAIKFAATPLQLFRMLNFTDSSNELDRPLSYSICNAINHFRQVEDSQLIDLFRELILQINNKNDFIIQCVKHCQDPDTLNEMLYYFEGKNPEKRDLLKKALVTCLFKQDSENAFNLIPQLLGASSSHGVTIEYSKVFFSPGSSLSHS